MIIFIIYQLNILSDLLPLVFSLIDLQKDTYGLLFLYSLAIVLQRSVLWVIILEFCICLNENFLLGLKVGVASLLVNTLKNNTFVVPVFYMK